MNTRFVVSVVAVFVADMLLNFLVHGMMLGAAYAKLVPGAFRTPEDSQQYAPYMLVQALLFAIGFTWIYRHGREARPWAAQGLRFGAAVAVMCTVPTFLTYYVVTPLPSDLVAQQCVLGAIEMLILGLVVAAVNRDPVAARA